MIRQWSEKLLLLCLLVMFMAGVMVVALAYLLAVLILVTVVSLGMYGYPYVHNAGSDASEKVAELVGLSDRVVGARYALFTAGLWSGAGLFTLGLLAGLFESLGLLALAPASLLSVVTCLSLLFGVPFGLAVGFHPNHLTTPGGGPIAQVVVYMRDRLG